MREHENQTEDLRAFRSMIHCSWRDGDGEGFSGRSAFSTGRTSDDMDEIQRELNVGGKLEIFDFPRCSEKSSVKLV
jgi:hypothetical protein